MALSKVNRLRSRQDFNAVYRRGIRRKSRHLTLLALQQLHSEKFLSGNVSTRPTPETASAAPTRVGISISLKVSKRAVVRNRLKRWLKVAARSLLWKFPVGWDIVVLVQPEATQCDYRQFLQELEQLLINAEVCDGD
ncbi:ribonuclease P protein component [Leptolyngbya sp. FACHB-321]|uniref:ribonuclease P protein component n=1 Tax=Leptolyngbya sp. FACHB-321 TaxID=2692807 RepID=UPI00168A0493|nr:ribonuclease P protein component [Leptolyngbya sp. FACHB-321]